MFRKLKSFLYRHVTASNRLTQAIDAQTLAIAAHTKAEIELIRVTLSAQAAIIKLPGLLEAVKNNTQYLAASERAHLVRSGQPHQL